MYHENTKMPTAISQSKGFRDTVSVHFIWWQWRSEDRYIDGLYLQLNFFWVAIFTKFACLFVFKSCDCLLPPRGCSGLSEHDLQRVEQLFHECKNQKSLVVNLEQFKNIIPAKNV